MFKTREYARENLREEIRKYLRGSKGSEYNTIDV